MERRPIAIDSFVAKPFQLFAKEWLLLTAGRNEPGQFNTMTIAWGGLGVLWSKPVAYVVVRPQRHTFGFLARGYDFTLCALGAEHREALTVCGTRSGRDGDKIQAARLTPVVATRARAPVFAEAKLVIECRQLYFQDLDPKNFLSQDIHAQYPQRDYHRMFVGEVLAVEGTAEYAGGE